MDSLGTTLNSSPLSDDHRAFILKYAREIGLDPNLALGIANVEGLRAWSASNPNAASTVDVENGKPFSFGDFQLNIHPGAMGSRALAAGVDPRDPGQWQAADKFALDQMKSGGVAPWKGDPVAAAYLKGGAAPAAPAAGPMAPGPIDPSIIARGGVSPAIPDATTPATPATPAGILPGFTTAGASSKFLKGAEQFGKAAGGESGEGGAQTPRASPMLQPQPPHMPQVGQTLNSPPPLQWGTATPGAGVSASPLGTSLSSLAQMQQMMMMLGGYGGGGYG